jgi:aminodeoxyfutalosine deaminase
MLGNGHQLDMRVAHLLHVFDQLHRHLSIGERLAAGTAHPGFEVDFIDGKRRVQPRGLSAVVQPSRIVPGVLLEAIDDGRGLGWNLGGKAVRIGLHLLVVWRPYIVLIGGAFTESGHEEFPDATGAPTHGVTAGVPPVEVADKTDHFSIGSPDREADAFHPVHGDDVGTHGAIAFVIGPLAVQVDFVIGKQEGKAVRIVELTFVAFSISGAQAIGNGFPGKGCDEKARRMSAPHRNGFPLDDHAHTRGLGLKRADFPLRKSALGSESVRAQDAERITVTTMHYRFNIGACHATLHYMASDLETYETEDALCELHLHLEGSVDPSTLCMLDPQLTREQAEAAYRFTDFAGFIECFKFIALRLRTPEDYALVTRRLVEQLAGQGVDYAEVTLSAGVLVWRGREIGPYYDAVRAASLSGPVEIRWILDAVRQFGPEPAWRVAEFAARRVNDGVAAIGIGGDELRGPASWFREVYDFSRSQGLRLTAHAGETDGPGSIWAALEIGAERIGHGIRAIEDPVLLRYLQDHQIPLEVCPTSNVCTGAVASIEAHPLRKLYDAGVPITLSTDDPGVFRCTLRGEYAVAQRLGLNADDLRSISSNAKQFRMF